MLVSLFKSFKLSEIASIVNGYTLGEDVTISSISTDTRENVEDSLFIPLSGENFDGHNFVSDALNKGAVASLFKKSKISGVMPSGNFLIVEDIQDAMLKFSLFIRREWGGRTIAITGSAGKTATKDMIHCSLSKRFKVTKSQKSFNNFIGLTLSILSLKSDSEILILELGTSKPGEIKTLAEHCKPNIGVITLAGKAHTEGLGSEEGVFKEKISLFDSILEEKGNVLVFPADDQRFLEYFENKNEKVAEKIGFTDKPVKDTSILDKLDKIITLSDIKVNNDKTLIINIDVMEKNYSKTFELKVNLLPPHFIRNVLATVSVCYSISPDSINESILTDFVQPARRFELRFANENIIIDDSYNSNPSSLESAISSLPQLMRLYKTEKIILVLGDMLELGEIAEEEHRKIALTSEKYLPKDSVFILFGKLMELTKYELVKKGFRVMHTNDKNEIAQYLKEEEKKKNSIIFVKGSRKMGLDEVVDNLI